MRRYQFKLKHDGGIALVTINASSKETAIETILKLEKAPVSAILNIRKL